jgi:hypothetical protein
MIGGMGRINEVDIILCIFCNKTFTFDQLIDHLKTCSKNPKKVDNNEST